jgi:glycosyltransferase involved in cell wall biosynthesis
MHEKLTAIVITKNEEKRIERCLESIQWADEILVIDNMSEDQTASVARRHGCTVIQHPQTSFGGQRNIGIRNASHEWILHLDADEVVPASLRDEIKSRALAPNCPYDAFALTMRIYFIGKPMLHGDWHSRNKKIRLARKEKGLFTETVHERLIVEGKVGILQETIDHYSLPSIANYLEKLNRYTDADVTELSPREQSYPLLIGCLLRPLKRFVGNYFIRGGWLDGSHGFILSVLEAMYQFSIFAKKWELERRMPKQAPSHHADQF